VTATAATILIVEDDESTRREVARNLVAHGYRVEEAATATEALHLWDARRPDLILLDLGLPDADGTLIIRRVRHDATTPILVVSARGEERTKVEALEAGADDYVTKPFGIPELHARIRVALRRAGGPRVDPDGILRNGTLELDVAGHVVRVDGRPVSLTPREFQILALLLGMPGRVVTRGRLLRAIWGEAYAGEDHYLHVYISQIRRKLAAVDPAGDLRDLIVAEPSVGYRVRNP
jgi:two-component system, OmpR family, KDP operon response regulator KdpE